MGDQPEKVDIEQDSPRTEQTQEYRVIRSVRSKEWCKYHEDNAHEEHGEKTDNKNERSPPSKNQIFLFYIINIQRSHGFRFSLFLSFLPIDRHSETPPEQFALG